MGIFFEDSLLTTLCTEYLLNGIKENNKDKIQSAFDDKNLNINKKDSNKTYPLLKAVGKNDINIIKLIIEYAKRKKISLELNEKNKKGNTPLIKAISKNNTEVVELLMNYAKNNGILLRINDKNNEGNDALMKAILNNNTDIIKLLIEYANSNNIILKINDKSGDGDNPFIQAIFEENKQIVKLLIDYANDHKIILKINEKGCNGYFPLIYAIYMNNIEIIKLIIDYANENNITLNINDKVKSFFTYFEGGYGDFPLIEAIKKKSVEVVKLLMEYSKKNNIPLNLNDKDGKNNLPLFIAIRNEDIEIIKLLMSFAKEENILLEINTRGKYDYSPLFLAIKLNNTEIVKLLMGYAEEEKIILKINDKIGSFFAKKYFSYEKGKFPLSEAIKKNNIEIVRLIMEYAHKNNITLEVNEDYLGEIYELSDEIVLLFIKHENIVNIINKDCGKLKKRIDDLKEQILEKEKERMKENENEKNKNDNMKEQEKEKSIKKNSGSLPVPSVVVATSNFIANEYDQLDLKENEFLIVTNWDCKEGWVYGHRNNNKNEKGLFPKVFIKICKNNSSEIKLRNSKTDEITPEYRILFGNKLKKFLNQDDMKKYFNKSTRLVIDRKNLFNSAFNEIMSKTPQELKNNIYICYLNEEGIDYGGLLRDFFYQISLVIGNPDYSFFQYSNDNSYELEVNPMSSVNPNHLDYFRFIGRVIGLAIFHEQYLPITFNALFNKKLLNIPLEISDIKLIDPEIYKNIEWLKNNEGVESLSLNFVLNTQDCFGNNKVVELKPNGANIDVTDSNKNEYIELVVNYKLNNIDDKNQLNSIKRGFYEIIPENINKLFDEYDLKYLISGIWEININDWEKNTEYEGYNKKDITIINFWKCVREFNHENRKKLLLFATGNSQVPVTGFKDLQGDGFIMHFRLKKSGNTNDLPKSHTCFNRIDLPPYQSYTILKQKLLYAISEGMGEFSVG